MIKIIITICIVLLAGCSSHNIFPPAPELHAIGVYEGTDPEDDGRPWHSKCGQLELLECRKRISQKKREVGGRVIVNVSIIDRPLILAFCAYDKTKWIVKLENGVSIEKVILGGYHAQSVEGIPENTPIEVYTHDSSPCARCYQGNTSFYSYKDVPSELKNISEIPPTSWQGKYKGLEFSIFPGMKQLDKP